MHIRLKSGQKNVGEVVWVTSETCPQRKPPFATSSFMVGVGCMWQSSHHGPGHAGHMLRMVEPSRERIWVTDIMEDYISLRLMTSTIL